MEDPKCPACGVAYKKHLGLHGTCEQLRIVIEALRELCDFIDACDERRIFRSIAFENAEVLLKKLGG